MATHHLLSWKTKINADVICVATFYRIKQKSIEITLFIRLETRVVIRSQFAHNFIIKTRHKNKSKTKKKLNDIAESFSSFALTWEFLVIFLCHFFFSLVLIVRWCFLYSLFHASFIHLFSVLLPNTKTERKEKELLLHTGLCVLFFRYFHLFFAFTLSFGSFPVPNTLNLILKMRAKQNPEKNCQRKNKKRECHRTKVIKVRIGFVQQTWYYRSVLFLAHEKNRKKRKTLFALVTCTRNCERKLCTTINVLLFITFFSCVFLVLRFFFIFPSHRKSYFWNVFLPQFEK